MFAQLLEAHGFASIGGPALARRSSRSRRCVPGAIDVYPEYTGTGLLAILHETPTADPREPLRGWRPSSERRWGIRWLPPLGFENTYAIAVRRETAESSGSAP